MRLENAIKRNRIKQARYRRAERTLRLVRQRIFDYEDMGKGEKASKVIATCKRILTPLWRCQRKIVEDRKLQNTPSYFE